MSIVLAGTLQPGTCVTCAAPPALVRALACPASPLVRAAVAGAFFALVLFLLTAINVPREFVCMLAVPFARVRRQ